MVSALGEKRNREVGREREDRHGLLVWLDTPGDGMAVFNLDPADNVGLDEAKTVSAHAHDWICSGVLACRRNTYLAVNLQLLDAGHGAML